jgi:glycosyltransferase involved in cell wall biosynthesis
MPVRNEERFIAPLIESVLAQEYPRDRLEVIVADGCSSDRTREIVAAMGAAEPRVTLIDNPNRIVSTGLNAAIRAARGDVIVRIDGHAVIASDFIRQNVDLLDEHPEAWSVGGPIRHAATSSFGQAVAVAMSHPLGVGNARHRYPDYEGYTEGAQFPTIRRWVFDRIGLFDVTLVRNQDDEFNFRMTQAGGRVFVSPRVRYSYFVREYSSQLFKQYFQYGFWRIPVMAKHHRPTTVRQIMPVAFYLVMIAMLVLGVAIRQPLLGLALPALYLAALLGACLSRWKRHGGAVAIRLPAAIATMHAGYALGMGYGGLASVFHRSAWNHHGRMATISR